MEQTFQSSNYQVKMLTASQLSSRLIRVVKEGQQLYIGYTQVFELVALREDTVKGLRPVTQDS